MASTNETRQRLASLLNEVAAKEGIHPTLVEGVGVARHSSPLPRTSVVYEPVIVFVGRGRKRSYLGDQVYVYDPATYFVLSVPLPAECVWTSRLVRRVRVVGSKIEP